MHFFTFLTAIVLAASPLSIVAGKPTSNAFDSQFSDPSIWNHNWTYRDAYTYCLGKGEGGTAVAALIAEHIESSDLQWDTIYQDDIKLANGGLLTLWHSERGRELAKRQLNPGGNTWLQAFPWVSNCNDWVSFTWAPLGYGCYSYWDNGQNLRMYSARGYIGDNGWAMRLFRDVNYCDRGTYYQHNFGDTFLGCVASSDGRGWMSFGLVLHG